MVGKGVMLPVFVVGIVTAFTLSNADAQPKYSLKKSQLQVVSGDQICGLIKSKWTPVKKAGKRYVVDSKNKSRCKSLLAPTSLKKSGIASIPSASGMLKARSSAAMLEVVGSPPLLKDIPTLGAKNVFWSSGLIESLNASIAPTQAQCQEFFHGIQDGQSAGMLGCFATQGVGYSFQSILEGGNSACLMKGIPTKANLDSNAISIVDGSLPDGDITKLFSPPSGASDRLIKIVIEQAGGAPGGNPPSGSGGAPPADGGGSGSKQYGFIRIHSSKKLAANGLQYGYNMWFCQDGQSTPNNYEETSVSLSGDYKLLRVHVAGTNKFQSEISAFLTKVGADITFDLTKERTARSTGEFMGSNFKSQVSVLPDNTITTKVKESFNGFGRSNFGVASFSGSGLADFSVRSAAIKDAFFTQTRQAGIEFRQPAYVSAPDTGLVAKLADVDLVTDPFYTESGAVTPDFSDKSCTAEVDVALSMDMSNPLLMQVFMGCANDRLSNMDFCRSAEMFQAQSKCAPPQ